MNEHIFEKLEYNKLKDKVKECCVSSLGRDLIDKLEPTGNIKTVQNRLNETTEARALLDYSGAVQLNGIVNIKEIITKVKKDMILDPEQLINVAAFLRGCGKIKTYMKDKEFYAPTLYSYSFNLEDLNYLEEEIELSIKNNRLSDDATTELKKIRRHIAQLESKIDEELNKFLKNPNNSNFIQDFFVTRRQGRLTVPIKSSYKNMVAGIVIESSGKTAFVEPNSVSKYTQKYTQLKIDESEEEYKILSNLTSHVYDNLYTFERNIEVMSHYDMVFAKGKYSKAIGGIAPKLNNYGYTKIVNGRHPLLEGNVVPLNVVIGDKYRSLVITGPNAGGKTIVLKTIGLLTLSMQSGFHIAVDDDTDMSVFDRVFADIGDDQSLENSLSTFSAHVKNLSYILRQTNKSTLLLFDEIGSGTEPNEGAALAIAILEEVYSKGAITVATTHYNEIKNFSSSHPDFENAAMRFNKDTLEPMYRMIIGKSGDSNALWISKKMGIYDDVLRKAEKYMKDKTYNLKIIDNGRKRIKKVKVIDEVKYNYETGDKVFINEINDSAIVYKEKDEYNNVVVFCNNEFKTYNVKQLKLQYARKELYPEDYDLNTLFSSYMERKVEKDIKRGSKKMLKRIHKYGYEKTINNKKH
ncbi:endonuclease MutS2 [Sedimentibacter sp. zth1]|uniref:endonuclease MutS2 n=1 Tax=Sedimentibacter sp. zth1 TaxID=2816908 RepID=UPI001A91CE59|nr:endonuclease MutS2 [Sedimentibacter sp. zth1]QSX05074.1 endonuclease MutS2 [Sedimentibacter sp. zth1]